MNAKYSTSRSDTWIVDVMDNDSVITSAEADSEDEALAMARRSAIAFYGSRAAMFEYAVYPPSPGAAKSKFGSEGPSPRTQRTKGPRLGN